MTDVFTKAQCQCGYFLVKIYNDYGDKVLRCFACGQEFQLHEIAGASLVKQKIDRANESGYGYRLAEELMT